MQSKVKYWLVTDRGVINECGGHMCKSPAGLSRITSLMMLLRGQIQKQWIDLVSDCSLFHYCIINNGHITLFVNCSHPWNKTYIFIWKKKRFFLFKYMISFSFLKLIYLFAAFTTCSISNHSGSRKQILIIYWKQHKTKSHFFQVIQFKSKLI